MIISNLASNAISLIKDFFGKGDKRSLNTKKNIVASFIIRILSIAISLILVPLTINYVNSVQYGIWITLSSIIGWLGYFDIGFGNGLRNRFAESVALGDYKMAKVFVSTTYAALGIIIILLILLIFLINPHLDWSKILNAPVAMNSELGLLALIAIVLFCLQLFLQLLTTVLTANQQPAKASAFNLIGSFISLVTIYVLTKKTSGNLIYLGLALSLPPVLVLLFSSFWFYTRGYRAFAPSIFHVNMKYIRSLMGLGIKFFILQIATLVLYQTSNIIIAQLLGSESVTIYNIAYKYFSVITMIMLIIMIPLWSAFTDAWAKKEVEWIVKTMKKLNFIWKGLSILVVIMLILSNPVYKLWVGSNLIIPNAISIALAINIIINVGAYAYSIFLNGVGIIKIQLYLSIVGTIINIPLAIFLGKLFGVPGVIFATSIINLINLIFFFSQYKKIVTDKATGIWAK